jgi:gluconokinase
MVIVLMGVSGAGKTTVGARLAAALGWPFHDGDDLHGAQVKAKMRLGQPLTDRDRAPWLARVRALIDGLLARGENAVIACSALRETYRAKIAPDPARVKIVYLRGSYETIAARLARRHGHFMPPGLLRSQFETLEEPRDAIAVDIEAPPDAIAAEIRRRLGL